ncbi:MAG: arginine--tRNA ligase [Clostridia bacterium]|nr:arginine--tRNA ligase [Clostridia bacterium]
MTLTEQLTVLVSDAFEACGYDRSLGTVTVSDRPELCQFQCNGAFGGAKLHRKAPAMIANDVAAKLNENSLFKSAEVAMPGFLNLTLTDDAIASMAADLASGERALVEPIGKGQTVVVDYGGPNVAKPLHIGHLRPAIIGEAIKRLCKVSGFNTIGDIHLGDWGLQIGLVITELRERNPEWRVFADDFDPAVDTVPTLDVELLQEVYPLASGKSKQDADYKLAAQQATGELQNGKAGYMALWREIMRVSIDDLKENYNRLNVFYELWYGESDAERYVGELVETLKAKELLRESDGALVVDLATEEDNAPMPPVIIKKSDNSSLYATTDLATIIQRQQDYQPNKIWYVVDKRQSLHFDQVFRCAKKAAIVPEETDLKHLGFGTINGADGKPFKTRDGGVMQLRTLIETVTDAAMDKLQNSDYLNSLSEDDKKVVAEKVGVAAIKFGDLINHRAKDYIFDMDKFLSFEGKTGTYLLYNITRINSVLKKVDAPADAAMRIDEDAERELMLKLLLTPEAFAKALAEQAPNLICENAYVIAQAFSKMYHDCPVANEADEQKRASRVALCRLTKDVLTKHLDVLGIEAVENM